MIIDASVAFKWIIFEEHSEIAEHLGVRTDLRAPDVLLAEVGHAIGKRARRGEIVVDGLADNFARLPQLLSLESSAADLSVALHWALRLHHSFYDCLYLAMAERLDDELVTADVVFVRKLRAAGVARRVTLLTEIAE